MDSRRAIRAASTVLALFVLAGAGLEPPVRGGSDPFAPAPDEGCVEASQAAGATPGTGQTETCAGAATGSGGGGAGVVGNLLPLVAIVIAGVVVIGLSGIVLVIRSSPRVAAGPIDGWWTCTACGASNLDAASRCHKCGAWQPIRQSRRGSRTTP